MDQEDILISLILMAGGGPIISMCAFFMLLNDMWLAVFPTLYVECWLLIFVFAQLDGMYGEPHVSNDGFNTGWS